MEFFQVLKCAEPCRYIQQVNQAAVTIQRWFRRHARRRRANRAALRRILDSKRKVCSALQSHFFFSQYPKSVPDMNDTDRCGRRSGRREPRPRVTWRRLETTAS